MRGGLAWDVLHWKGVIRGGDGLITYPVRLFFAPAMAISSAREDPLVSSCRRGLRSYLTLPYSWLGKEQGDGGAVFVS